MKTSKTKFDLFDISEWDYFIDTALRGWVINEVKLEHAEIASNLIEDLLIIPLSEYIEKQHKKVPNSTLVISGNNLVNYLKFDIADRFKNNQHVMIEQLDRLDRLVKEFLATCSSATILANSAKQSKKAKASRIKNKPTKRDLEKFKSDYIIKETNEYGWIKSAARYFAISTSTVSRILNNNSS